MRHAPSQEIEPLGCAKPLKLDDLVEERVGRLRQIRGSEPCVSADDPSKRQLPQFVAETPEKRLNECGRRIVDHHNMAWLRRLESVAKLPDHADRLEPWIRVRHGCCDGSEESDSIQFGQRPQSLGHEELQESQRIVGGAARDLDGHPAVPPQAGADEPEASGGTFAGSREQEDVPAAVDGFEDLCLRRTGDVELTVARGMMAKWDFPVTRSDKPIRSRRQPTATV
jgi:hypothetical protein